MSSSRSRAARILARLGYPVFAFMLSDFIRHRRSNR